MPVRGSNSLYFSPEIDNSLLQQGASQAINIVSQMGSTIASINPFAALAVGALTAFATVSAEAYSFARNYEVAMKEVQTISKATQEDFKGISSAIIELSKNTTDDPIKLAKAYYQIVSAGYDGAEGMNLLEVASKAAVAGVTDTETAADGLTTVLNAFKLEAEDAESVSDALFKTVELGKTTFSELSQNLSQAAPLAAATGVNFQELLAAVASLTKQGVPTSQAMTQIRAAIEATSKVLGDGWANAYTLQEAFQVVSDQAGGSQNKLKELTGTVEAVSAILSTTGDNAKGASEDLNELTNSAGAASAAFGTQMTGNINQWTILSNRIKATTEELGNYLLEISSGAARSLNRFFEDTEKISKALEKERIELLLTEASIIDTNTETEKRVKLIEQLKEQYPDYLSDLDAESVTNKELSAAIRLVNDELKNKIVLQKADDQLNAKLQDRGDIALELNDQEQKAKELLIRQLDKEGRLYDGNKDLLEQLIDANDRLNKKRRESEGFGGGGGFQIDLSEGIKSLNPYITSITNLREELDGFNDDVDALTKRRNQVAIDLNLVGNEDEVVEDLQTSLKNIEEATKRSDLAQYLQSQNEEIRKAAEERLKYLRSLLGTDDSDNVNRPKVSEVNSIQNQKVNLEFDFTIDTTSIDFIENQIRVLTKKFNAANESDRASIKIDLDEWRKRLKIAQDGTDDLAELRKELNYQLEDLSLKELKKEKERWKEKLKLYDQGTEAYELVMSQIDAVSQNASDRIVEVFSQVTGSINEAKRLFETFGAGDDLGEALTMLSELGTAAGNLFSGNPGQMVQGGLQALNAVFSTGISSETSRFEKSIKDLSESIDKLKYALSNSTGQERIDNTKDLIAEYAEAELEYQKAIKAEEDARKQFKYLGIGLWKKDRGSGTDQAKVEQLTEDMKEAGRQAEELKRQLDELLTGTTATSITDSIIEGFKEGKRSIEDFAGTFEDMMQDALLNAFNAKYLAEKVGGFYDDFALYSDTDGDGIIDLTAEEIAALKNQFGNIISGAETQIDAINDILGLNGFDALGSDNSKTGLSGAISTITEDTANILEGTLNAIRLDVASGLSVATQNSQYLSQIVQNTQYNRFLESIDGRIASIESGLLQIQAQG